MTIFDHLLELRGRFIRIVLVILVIFISCFIFSDQLLTFIKIPLDQSFSNVQLATNIEDQNQQAQTTPQLLENYQCSCQKESSEVEHKEPVNIVLPSNMPEIFTSQATNLQAKNSQADEANGNNSLSCNCRPLLQNEVLEKEAKPETIALTFLSLPDILLAKFRLSFLSALFFSFPYLLAEIWGFASPAMYKNEKKFFWIIMIGSVFCFIGGAIFSYFIVFPRGFQFFLSLTPTTVAVPNLTIDKYLDFATTLIFMFGITFELPVACLVLAKFEIITAPTMLKYSKIAILIIFFVAAVFTPPDPLSMLLMALPLVALYFLSYLIVGVLLGFKVKNFEV